MITCDSTIMVSSSISRSSSIPWREVDSLKVAGFGGSTVATSEVSIYQGLLVVLGGAGGGAS